MHKAATAASRGMLRDFGEVENLQVSRKGPADFVSRADTNAERVIRANCKRHDPTGALLWKKAALLPVPTQMRLYGLLTRSMAPQTF
jgi:myo-inositol-1(or 4)-monophosphatase